MNGTWKAGFVVETHGAEETEALGRCCGALRPWGFVLALRGDLGAGKTVFVRGLAAGLLEGDEIEVTSPTYVLQHVYRGQEATLYHIDAYRMSGGAEEFEGAGLRDCLNDRRGVVCLEWPERVEEVLPADRLEVELEHAGGDTRTVHVLATGVLSGALADALAQRVGSRFKLENFLGRPGPAVPPAEAAPPSLS
ncbi:MAG: hypothetical protein AMXMBFR7_06480 [Planctomycetota bacterium]